jgi:hypothetical protein
VKRAEGAATQAVKPSEPEGTKKPLSPDEQAKPIDSKTTRLLPHVVDGPGVFHDVHDFPHPKPAFDSFSRNDAWHFASARFFAGHGT